MFKYNDSLGIINSKPKAIPEDFEGHLVNQRFLDGM
jgi:hypothetical protein